MNDETEEPNLTQRELCKLDKISLATLYAIEKAGYGPEWLIYPGTNIKRITAAGRRAWHEKLQQYRADHAEALAVQRRQRSERASVLGRLAVQSPQHPCRKRGKSATKSKSKAR